jgi:serine/threonine-protein kinase
VARLNHPGITTVYEMFEHAGRWLMVMEFVRGETLEALIARTGPLSPENAAEICLPALAALAHAHSLGVVHRDLKPANLMITEGGVVKVMDFGIARVSGSEHLTSTGFMMGTPAYMAPEQVLGREIDARSDLYAMGVVFYRLVTGRLPFTGETPFAVAQAQINDVHTPIGAVRVDLPPWADAVVEGALAKNPQERFQSAAAFHAALSRCLSDRVPSTIRDSSRAIALAVTPPFAVPTGTIRPVIDPELTVLSPDRTTRSVPLASGAMPAGAARPPSPARAASPSLVRRGVLALAAGVVVLTVIAGVIWRGRTPAASTAETTPPASSAAPTPPPAPAASAEGRRSGAPAAIPSPAPPQATGGPVVFGNAKLLTVTGRKAKDQDVVVSLLTDRISVTAKNGGAPLQSLVYGRVLRATYVKAKAPKFDPGFPAPPADLDMPGVFASSHHWLALQTKETYLILRLDDANYARILETVQTRARVKVAKPG